MKISHPQEIQGKLTEGNLGSHLVQLTVPMICGMFAIISFNLVDTYFVAQLGTNELAAVSFTFPVMMIIASLGMGLGIGSTSVISRAIGQGNRYKVQRLTTDSLILSLLIVVILSFLGLGTIESLFGALGASSEVLPLIRDYMEITYLGLICFLIPLTASETIRAAGNAIFPGLMMIGATLLNLVLDPLLIFGWGVFPTLGIQGAALATVIAKFVAMTAALIFLNRQRMILFRLPKFKEVFQSWRKILYIAIPAAASHAIKPISMGLIVSMIAFYGRDAVAGFGIASRLEGLALLVFLALSVSINPVVGQNWGAGKFNRVNQAFLLSIRFCLLWGGLAAIVLGFASPWLASHFDKNPDVVSVAVAYLAIVPISYAAAGIIQIASSTFNAIGRPLPSVTLILSQVFILYVPLAMIGSRFFGINGIFAAVCLSNVAVGIVAFIWNRRVCRVRRYSSEVNT